MGLIDYSFGRELKEKELTHFQRYDSYATGKIDSILCINKAVKIDLNVLVSTDNAKLVQHPYFLYFHKSIHYFKLTMHAFKIKTNKDFAEQTAL